MEDSILKIAFYVIIGIIYIVMQLRKKIKPNPKPHPVSNSRPATTFVPQQTYETEQKPVKHNPVTLEDLMKQFGMGEEEEVKTEPYIEPKVLEDVNIKTKKYNLDEYDDSYVDEEEKAQDKIKGDIEESINLKKQRVSLLDEHFDSYSLDKNEVNKYALMLKDPESIRAAFIMSEIFNRKY